MTEAELTVTDKWLEFYRRYLRDEIGELALSDEASLPVDLQDVFSYDREMYEDIRDAPEQMGEYAEEALRQYDLPADVTLTHPRVRFYNTDETHTYEVGAYSTGNNGTGGQIGELIGVTGQVNKRSKKRTRLVTGVFECLRCGTTTEIPQDGEDRQEPHECEGCERQGPFKLDTRRSQYVDDQQIRLQLPPERAEGASDENIDVTLEGDLVNSVSPGDRVNADVLLDLREKKDGSTLFQFVAEGQYLQVEESDFSEIEAEEEEVEEIHDIASADPFAAIIDSIAPSLKGLDTPKLAIALQLFGGVEKTLPDGSTERGDSHVFLVGDPGTGKSELLGWANRLAPRSVFSDGKGSSAAGITAAAVRDDFGDSEWTLEGGTIVKAHNGMACIDELDDMEPEDRSALHTALEKQKVPVSKAGINTELPAKTRLLAAANPEHGRFDIYEPVADQIDVKPTLLSRFDLIFTFTDVPDREQDREIIEHKATAAEVGQKLAAGMDVERDKRNEVAPEIDEDLLRKYIAYAQQSVTPVFDSDARELLEREFNDLRHANATEETDPEERPIPVTYRKQEGITRLAEGSARIRLSNTITTDDVRRALDLVKESMRDVGMDPESGEFDTDLVETGTSKSQRQRVKTVKTTVTELAKQNMEGAPIDDVIEEVQDSGVTEQRAQTEIENLKKKGELYEPSEGYLRTS